LELAGIGRQRLHLAWVSSAEAQRFVEVVSQTTETIRSLGKFDPQRYHIQLAAVEDTLTGEPVRWLVGKEVKITRSGDVYGRPWDARNYEALLDKVLEREYQSNLILQTIRHGCSSPREIHAQIGLPLQRISFLLADMEKKGRIQFKGMQACKPIFAAS
jgi:hypothetical protein